MPNSLDQFFRTIFLKEYSNLEKVIVLLNVFLFSLSLSEDNQKNVDQDVNTAILYIMFTIAYFVSSTSCLSGAYSLKSKACATPAENNLNSSSFTTSEMKKSAAKQYYSSKTKKVNLCNRLGHCLNVATSACESYASSLLRFSFFTLNVVMFWLCIVSLD